MINNTLLLYRGDDLLSSVVLQDTPIEVGPSRSADLMVDDPCCPAILVQPRGGTVWMFPLGETDLSPRVLPLGTPVNLGSRHRLVRAQPLGAPVRGRPGPDPGPERAGATQRLDRSPFAAAGWTILLGSSREARRVRVSDRPLRVGSAADNDLVLHDRTVSAHHCRFEPTGAALVLRDLDSTNGTHVHGLRVQRVEVVTGTRVRVGRTDLCVMATERRSDAVRPALVTASPGMQRVVADAQAFARLPWPVLVLGPSGVGKEEIAGAIHKGSARARGPFVAVNAGGLPRELVESELFGHERGAFTGAVTQRRGAFEQAQGGTLLLDEIGELPLDMQTRLLRVLEAWQIRRVGAEAPMTIDVRLICATHRDLPQMVRAGTFREDLYYRLARLVVRIPPLCDRPADVLPLAEHFLAGLEAELGPRALSPEAACRLQVHPWPGNARELRNVLCAATALTPSSVLQPEDIERAIERLGQSCELRRTPADVLERAVHAYQGNLSAVSRALGVPRSTVRDRVLRLGRQRASGETEVG